MLRFVRDADFQATEWSALDRKNVLAERRPRDGTGHDVHRTRRVATGFVRRTCTSTVDETVAKTSVETVWVHGWRCYVAPPFTLHLLSRRRARFKSASVPHPRLCQTLNTRRRSRVSVLVYEYTHFRFGSIRFFLFFYFILNFPLPFPPFRCTSIAITMTTTERSSSLRAPLGFFFIFFFSLRLKALDLMHGNVYTGRR